MGLAAYINVILNGICIGGLYGLTSSAFTFQVGALRMTNFAYGASIMLSMYITFFMLRVIEAPIIIVILVIVVFNFLLGLAIRKTILKHINRGMNILCTMGLQLIIINLVLFIFTAYPRDLTLLESRIYFTDKISIGATQLICFFLAAVVLIGFHFFLQKTWYGRAIRAVVQNKDVAYLMGINSEKVLDMAFSLSYILIGVAGMMLMLMFSAEPEFGNYIQLIAFVVCIVAGLGNLRGAFITGIIVGVISSLISTLLGSIYHDPIFFSVFVIVLLLRPHGIFNKKSNVARSTI